MNTEILQEIGFSKGEIKVYFALIEMGETTIGPLSKRSKVTPAKVYPILEKLSEKGLSTNIIKSGIRHFEAVDPKQIIRYLEEKTQKINLQKEDIKKMLPVIELKKKLSEDLQKAQIYQTFDGIRTLYNEIIETLKKEKEDFIAFTLGREEYNHKESKYFFQEYDNKRRSAGIKTKLLGQESQRKFLESITKKDKNIELKFLPYQMPTGVIIFGNKVATLIWRDIPTAFVIQSKQASNSYRNFFFDMWKIAKK
ncbi:MAG: helix-turn-helix domain-containing protein [Candidatus Woesearchaeota archaeon]